MKNKWNRGWHSASTQKTSLVFHHLFILVVENDRGEDKFPLEEKGSSLGSAADDSWQAN